MKLPKRVPGPLITVVLLIVCFVVIKAIPSLLWPERGKSLVEDEGYQGGHYTIGINERAIGKGASTLLFTTLKKWRFDPQRPRPAPEEVMANDNRFVKVTGFMYPLQSGAEISAFCLLRSTQTCCYGPKPEFNQYVLVEMDHPVTFDKLRPVEIAGTFHVEARPEDGYIYRMEGTSLKFPEKRQGTT